MGTTQTSEAIVWEEGETRFNLDQHNFTDYQDSNINRLVASQVEEMSKYVVERVKDMSSLFLLGGYARGEGSVLVSHDGLVPLGDYDFLAITNHPHLSVSFPDLESMRRKFHVQYHIEVGNNWKRLLPLVDPQIYWYEAKFGSKHLCGETNTLASVPISGAQDIDMDEGFRLMFNRLIGMLSVFDPRFLDQEPLEEQKEHLIFQSVKGILSCGESLLLLNGAYNYSYKKRWHRLSGCFEKSFPELVELNPSLKADFEKASLFKLRPSYRMYNDSVELWLSAKNHVLQTLSFFLTKLLKIPSEKNLRVEPLTSFCRNFLVNRRPELLDYVTFNWHAITGTRNWRGISNVRHAFSDLVRLASYYLAMSISEKGEIDPKMLDKSLKIIESIHEAPFRINTEGMTNARKGWKIVENIIVSTWQNSRH